jgi:hypothetical protein
MKLVTQDNLQSVLEQQDAMAVINAFQSLLRKKAKEIIRYRRYSGVIEQEDLLSAAHLDIVQLLREGKFKYLPEKGADDNFHMFTKIVGLRIHSAMMREKDSHSYPIKIRRSIIEKMRTAYEIVGSRRNAPRSVMVNMISHRCKVTIFEAVHLSKIASLSFFNGLTYLSGHNEDFQASDDDCMDYNIPCMDEGMENLVITDLFQVLRVPFQRTLMSRVVISGWSLPEIAKQYELPLGYVTKHYKIALNRIKEEVTQ